MCKKKALVTIKKKDIKGKKEKKFAYMEAQQIQVFDESCKWMTVNKDITNSLNESIILNIYGLYKQATEGNAPDQPPSSSFNIFDNVKKQRKHDAWRKYANMTKTQARSQYIAIINQLKQQKSGNI